MSQWWVYIFFQGVISETESDPSHKSKMHIVWKIFRKQRWLCCVVELLSNIIIFSFKYSLRRIVLYYSVPIYHMNLCKTHVDIDTFTLKNFRDLVWVFLHGVCVVCWLFLICSLKSIYLCGCASLAFFLVFECKQNIHTRKRPSKIISSQSAVKSSNWPFHQCKVCRSMWLEAWNHNELYSEHDILNEIVCVFFNAPLHSWKLLMRACDWSMAFFDYDLHLICIAAH